MKRFLFDDYPQWRGVRRDGISGEKGLLKAWTAGGPKLLWSLSEVGGGYGTPSVAKGRLFVQGNVGMDNEYVYCHDTRTGKPLWKLRLGKVGNPNQQPSYPGSRSTPTVDGALLYALGSDGDLVCADVATGKERWRKSLRTDFGGQPGVWAYAESPLIDGNRLVCMPGATDATLAALDKKTGATLWKCAVPDETAASYASPVVAEVGGRRLYVQFLSQGVVGVDALTGKLLWRSQTTRDLQFRMSAQTPVVGSGMVYTAANNRGGTVRLKPTADGMEAEPVYLERGLPSALGGTLLLNGYLYGTNPRALVCAEFATGKIVWQNDALGAGSICYADGHLYVHGEESGAVALIEATPTAYKEKGRFTPPNLPQRGRGEKAWAYPVVANGRLYLRDINRLWCYNIKA